MNFDELQKQWNQQSGDSIDIKDEYLTRSHSIIEKINSNYRKEIKLSAVSFIFLLFAPALFQLDKELTFIFYFLLVQMALSSFFYFKRLYAFRKMTGQAEIFSTHESLVKVYYELKFAVETYRSSCYILIPSGMGMYFIIIAKNQAHEWFMKLYNFTDTFYSDPTFLWLFIIISLALFIFLIFFCEWMLNKFYGKYLKELREILDQFAE